MGSLSSGSNNYGRRARIASKEIARAGSELKNEALYAIADNLLNNKEVIKEQNVRDIQEGESFRLSASERDRIVLTDSRIDSMVQGVRQIATLPDPVGELFDMDTRPNGMVIGKRRVPLGVICSIFENRPNVTIDISALSLKAGNACILRGGKEAINSNRILTRLIQEAISRTGLSKDVVQFVDSTDRSLVDELLAMSDYIDLMVPRGGSEFINFVKNNARMPVLLGGIGVCHTYVDRIVDECKALNIVMNAKVKRPSVCNALDTLLVHSKSASTFLPAIAKRLGEAGVEMRCDNRSLAVLGPCNDRIHVKEAQPEDFGKEFLDLIIAIKVVDSLEEAIGHIDEFGSGHSEAIVTEDYSTAMKFLDQVDAAAVFVNVSTYFHDGGQFGLGAEVGISTQKLHARGPLGLKEITSYKWIVFGDGQVRD